MRRPAARKIELVVTSRGAGLADVYASGGGVVMGTLRIEKERADEAERERLRLDAEYRQREFEAAEAETRARMALLESELEARRTAFLLASRRHQTMERLWESQRKIAETLRGADEQ